MKTVLFVLTFQIIFITFSYAQVIENGIYFGEKGWLPGSATIIAEVHSDTITYEVYIHYYTDSYYEKKKGTIILNDSFVNENDSIQIIIDKNCIVFHDYSLGLKKKLKKNDNELLINRVRNLSYADKKARLDSNINSWDLYYEREDIIMNHDEFCRKVDSIYNKLINKR